jgi:hypothetical protein
MHRYGGAVPSLYEAACVAAQRVTELRNDRKDALRARDDVILALYEGTRGPELDCRPHGRTPLYIARALGMAKSTVWLAIRTAADTDARPFSGRALDELEDLARAATKRLEHVRAREAAALVVRDDAILALYESGTRPHAIARDLGMGKTPVRQAIRTAAARRAAAPPS